MAMADGPSIHHSHEPSALSHVYWSLDQVADQSSLFLHELRDPVVREVEQRQQRVSTERDGLRRTLNLDEAAIAGLDDVHVDVRPAVVLVRQIEQRLAVDDADA